MHGAIHIGLRSQEFSDSCDLRDITESERVVQFWCRLKCGTARTVLRATIKERSAAACRDDVERVPERRIQSFHRGFSPKVSEKVSTIRRKHEIW